MFYYEVLFHFHHNSSARIFVIHLKFLRSFRHQLNLQRHVIAMKIRFFSCMLLVCIS